jgi:regulatory protein
MADEKGRAWETALRALNVRDRTEREIRELLERKDCDPEAIEDAIAELLAEHLIDDYRFAERFIEDKRELEAWGHVRIALDLERRGVPPETIEEALAEDGADELVTALALLEARIAAIEGDRDRDRAWRLLLRRGYEPELAYSAVREHEKRLRGS